MGTSQSFFFTVLIESGTAGLVGYSVFYGYLIYYYIKNLISTGFLLTKELSKINLAVVMGYLAFIIATGDMRTFSLFFVIVTMGAKVLYLKKMPN